MLEGGQMLGPYRIECLLGAGGMGQVYKARDTRLDRTVAIKVVSPDLVANGDAKSRFEREARSISQLQHPHVCVLHDVGSENGMDYLVMEYLDGETLADRLRRGPMPLSEAQKIAVQIASALDKAHRSGILHRDLKPGNVMLTKAGPKLLDFGLAKPLYATAEAVGMSSIFSATAAATMTSPAKSITTAGAIVGTVQYMSPEQLEGKEPDARSDIFAFGLILYEMIAGRRAFEGKSQASVVASILALEPPPISSLKPEIPPMIDSVVGLCLAKDPDERLQSAHDLKLQLELLNTQASIPQQLAAPPVSALTRWGPLATLSIVTALAIGAALVYRSEASAIVPPVRSSIEPPEDNSFSGRSEALSPDGTTWAFVANGKNGRQLWVRKLDSLSAQSLNGTENADFPFWSQDSRNVGFFDGQKLKRIEASGGPAQIICDASPGRGGTWNAHGVILFSSGNTSLYRVAASGGTPVEVTKLDEKRGEISHRWPWFLPDGKHFIFQVITNGGQQTRSVQAGSLDSSERHFLLNSEFNAEYSAGYLVFWRDDSLVAQPFDTGKLTLSGEPTPIAENVDTSLGVTAARFSVSENGSLAYLPGGTGHGWQPFFADATGKPVGEKLPKGLYFHPNVSLDGKRLAINILTGDKRDIWVMDVARRTQSRVTFDGASDNPVWSPDGNLIYYGSFRNGHVQIFARHSDGSGTEEAIVTSAKENVIPEDVSRDGRYLLYSQTTEAGLSETWALPLFGDRKPFVLIRDNNHDPKFSPDGKFVAYINNNTGPYEDYITPFPSGGAKWQVSSGGGGVDRWRGDGKVLYFLDPRGVSMVTVTETGGAVALSIPQALFSPHLMPGPSGPFTLAAQDGSKFFLNATNDAITTQHVNAILLTNWPAELKR
jgi:serine/threonine protein kinase